MNDRIAGAVLGAFVAPVLGRTEIVSARATDPSGRSSQRQAMAMGSTSSTPTFPSTRSRMAQKETATPTNVNARTGSRTGISRHAANSAALLRDPRVWFDLVRPGLLMYGVAPGPLPCPIPAGRHCRSPRNGPPWRSDAGGPGSGG